MAEHTNLTMRECDMHETKRVPRRPLGQAVLLLLSVVHGSWALTWDFQDGVEGWTAGEELFKAGNAEFEGQSIDGRWYVDLDGMNTRQPSVRITSPAISRPSEWYDRLEIRYRLVGEVPQPGLIFMGWINSTNSVRDPSEGFDRQHYMFTESGFVYGTEWQTLILTRFSEDTSLVWQEALEYFWVDLVLYDPYVQTLPPAGLPTAIEFDWIRLTGILEPPGEDTPNVEALPEVGTVFDPPATHRAFAGIGTGGFVSRGAEAGDLNADGYPDVAGVWTQCTDNTGECRQGWFVSMNGGPEGFGRPRLQEVGEQEAPFRTHELRADLADLDMDGDIDLLFRSALQSQVLANDGMGGLAAGPSLPRANVLGVGDAEGDGEPDIISANMPDEEAPGLRRYRVASDGLEAGPPSALGFAGLYPIPLGLDQALGEPVRVHWVPRSDGLADWVEAAPWAESLDQVAVDLDVSWDLVRYIGQLDEDSAFEIVTSLKRHPLDGRRFLGLQLLDGTDDGIAAFAQLGGARVEVEGPAVGVDIDGDGAIEILFTDRGDARGPVVGVARSAEGWATRDYEVYMLPTGGQPRAPLPADVDQDGHTDLVVVDPVLDGGALIVLPNSGRSSGTSVADLRPREAPSDSLVVYPNPANGQVVVRLGVGGDSRRLFVYDALGQKVLQRRVPDGTRAFTWDGRGDSGLPVSSGAYWIVVENRVGRHVTRLAWIR